MVWKDPGRIVEKILMHLIKPLTIRQGGFDENSIKCAPEIAHVIEES